MFLMSTNSLMAAEKPKKGKYSRISSSDYPATSLQCQFHSVSEQLSRITCADLCIRSDCSIFGTQAGDCAVCWKCNTGLPISPALIPFDVMYIQSEYQLKY